MSTAQENRMRLLIDTDEEYYVLIRNAQGHDVEIMKMVARRRAGSRLVVDVEQTNRKGDTFQQASYVSVINNHVRSGRWCPRPVDMFHND